MIAYVRCLHIVSGHTVLQEGFTTMYLPSIPLLSVFVRSPSFKAALLSGWLWPPLLWLLVLACSVSLLPLLLLYRTFSTPCSPCAGAAWWWSWALGLGQKAWLGPLCGWSGCSGQRLDSSTCMFPARYEVTIVLWWKWQRTRVHYIVEPCIWDQHNFTDYVLWSSSFQMEL